MSHEHVTFGWASRVEVNGQPFAVRSCGWTVRTDAQDVTDTESNTPGQIPFRKRKAGLVEADIRLSGHLATDQSPYAAPFLLVAPFVVPVITVWPHGRDFPSRQFFDVLITEYSEEPSGDPNQPNAFSAHGFPDSWTLGT